MFHQAFALIDWVVLVAYLMIVVMIGIVYRAGKTDGILDYFFARGRMPWWAVGISLIATSVSASTFLGNPAEAYQFDLRLLQLNLGVPISIIIVCLVFIPFYQRLGASSAYEVLERRFDLKTRTLASIFYMVHVMLRTGILIFGPALMISQVTGIDVKIVVVAVGIVALFYTTLGGLRAVIWTDVLQFFILLGGGVLVCTFVAYDVPGGFSAVFEAASQSGKTQWLDFSWGLENPRNIWAAGIAYITLDLAIRSTDQQFVQRYLSCVDTRRSRYAAILSAVLGLFVAMLFFAVGIFLWAFYRTYPAELAVSDVNRVLPHYIATKLPWGVSGLIVAGVFAAAMSSIDSAVNAVSNTATIDFYKRFGGSDVGGLRFARIASLICGVIGIGIGIFSATVGKNLFILALSFTSLFTGALLGIFVLALATKRVSGWGAFIGAIMGMFSLAIITKVLHLSISWPWYPLISMSVTVLTGWISSIIAPKRISA